MSSSTQSLIAKYAQHFDESPTSLDRFLSQHGPLEHSQIHTLILWEQAQSWRNGVGTRCEELFTRYPELFTDRELVLDLIYSEYLLSRKLDPTITLEQFTVRFPNYAEQLRQQVDFHEGMGGELIDDWLDCDNKMANMDSVHQPLQSSDLLPSYECDQRPSMPRVPKLSMPGYRLLGELGRGGWAVVYLAEDERLHRRVALKMLLAGKLASEALLRRMQVEGEAIARLQHPHIIQIFEVGQHEDHSYLALEYANSGTLAHWMRRQPKPPRQAATIVGQLARTVQFAHDNGILHRDLKPGNVLLHNLNATDEFHPGSTAGQTSELDDISHLQLKIADFGLAKFINHDSHERPIPVAATMTGDLLGTAAYMSPEQAKGSARQLTAATDIYSLGAVLYELLTGRPPFIGADPLELLSQVMLDDPVRPSDLVAHTPRDLETICFKCLHKNPDRRYETADELANEIDRYLSNQPIKARRTSTIERSWRWCRRHPAQASSLLFVATLVLLIIGGLVQYSEIMRERLASISVSNERERTLRHQALEQLFESHLSRASALLTSRQVGQRFASLEALEAAQRMSVSIELSNAQRQRIRNGVLAALTLPDIQYQADWTLACDPLSNAFDIDSQQRVIAVATAPSQVTLVDNRTAASLLTINTQPTIDRVALNHDATLLAIIGPKLQIYDLTTQPSTCKIELDRQVCSFSTVNARELLVVTADAVIKRLNIDTSESEEVFRSAGKPRQISMAPNGRSIAVWTDDRIEVADTHSAQVQLRLPPPMAVDDRALVWNQASTTLAVGPYQHGIELWDVPDRCKLITIAQNEPSSQFCFDATGGRLLIYCHWGSYIQLWNLTSGQCEFTQKNMQVRSARTSGTGFVLWQSQAANQLTVTSIVTPSLVKELPSISRASAVASNVLAGYNRDGSIIAVIKDGTLEFFDTVSLKLLGKVIIGSSYFQFDPSDNLITLNSQGMRRWPKRVSQATQGRTLEIEYGPPEKMLTAYPLAPFELSRDGKLVGVSDGDRVVLWSINHGREHASFPHEDVRRLAFSPDSQLCATGGWNSGNVNIWNVVTGKKIKQIDDSSPCVVRFSGDGQWLAVASKDISVWSTRDWKLAWRREVMGPVSSGTNLCFSPDSQQLAVSNALGKIHLLGVLDGGTPYAEITSPIQDQILEMVFAAEGRQLAISTFRGASVWDLNLLRHELTTRDLDWDHRIEKFFNLTIEKQPAQKREHGSASVPAISFHLDEEARQSEALEQASRVDAATARFDYQPAQAAIDRAIELGLNNPTACNDLAWRMVTGPIELRNPRRALELIDRAINFPQLSESRRAIYLNTLGVVQYRAGLFDEAFATLTKSLATQKPKDQPHDLYFLSMCAAQRGDKLMAKEFFDRAESLRKEFYASIRLQPSRELAEFAREAQELLESRTAVLRH